MYIPYYIHYNSTMLLKFRIKTVLHLHGKIRITYIWNIMQKNECPNGVPGHIMTTNDTVDKQYPLYTGNSLYSCSSTKDMFISFSVWLNYSFHTDTVALIHVLNHVQTYTYNKQLLITKHHKYLNNSILRNDSQLRKIFKRTLRNAGSVILGMTESVYF